MNLVGHNELANITPGLEPVNVYVTILIWFSDPHLPDDSLLD